jgi:hypothetical protein
MIPLRNPGGANTRSAASKASSMPAAEREVNYWIQRAGSHGNAKENLFFTVRLTKSQVSFTARAMLGWLAFRHAHQGERPDEFKLQALHALAACNLRRRADVDRRVRMAALADRAGKRPRAV